MSRAAAFKCWRQLWHGALWSSAGATAKASGGAPLQLHGKRFGAIGLGDLCNQTFGAQRGSAGIDRKRTEELTARAHCSDKILKETLDGAVERSTAFD